MYIKSRKWLFETDRTIIVTDIPGTPLGAGRFIGDILAKESTCVSLDGKRLIQQHV